MNLLKRPTTGVRLLTASRSPISLASCTNEAHSIMSLCFSEQIETKAGRLLTLAFRTTSAALDTKLRSKRNSEPTLEQVLRDIGHRTLKTPKRHWFSSTARWSTSARHSGWPNSSLEHKRPCT